MRILACMVLALGLHTSAAFAQDEGNPRLLTLEASCEKKTISIGEPLSLRLRVTIEGAESEKAPVRVGFFDPGFTLIRRERKSDGAFDEPLSLPFLPVGVSASDSEARPVGIDFAPGATTATVDIVLLAYFRRGDEPSRPGLEVFKPYFEKCGTFEVLIGDNRSAMKSNAIEITVQDISDTERAAMKLFYAREHVRFLMSPREWNKWSRGLEIADSLVTGSYGSAFAAYALPAVGIARLDKATKGTEESKRQLLIEALTFLETSAERLPSDCPLLQEVIMSWAGAHAELGDIERAKELWNQLLDKYPHSPLGSRAQEALRGAVSK